jgi:hypothetical protein
MMSAVMPRVERPIIRAKSWVKPNARAIGQRLASTACATTWEEVVVHEEEQGEDEEEENEEEEKVTDNHFLTTNGLPLALKRCGSSQPIVSGGDRGARRIAGSREGRVD